VGTSDSEENIASVMNISMVLKMKVEFSFAAFAVLALATSPRVVTGLLSIGDRPH
jgi:hypothetical protein